MRFTRSQMNDIASDLEKGAARSDRNAASGEAAANNSNLSQDTRDCAARAAANARSNAAQARNDATLLRNGIIPE